MNPQPDLVAVLVAQLAEADDATLAPLAERLEAMRPAAAPSPATTGWLDTAAAAAYLGITRNALHKLTSARAIPFEQDGPGCRCYFKACDLDAWRRSSGTRTHV